MKRVRWKSRYASGDPAVDARNRQLVGLLETFGGELARKEHCQDMTELYADLAELAQGHLDAAPAELGRGDGHGFAQVRDVLRGRFPLAALSTPACKACGLCDLLEGQIRGWLGEPPVDPRLRQREDG
jgi:hypothetical protein